MSQQINLLNLHLVVKKDPVNAQMLLVLVLGGALLMVLVYAWMTYRSSALEQQYRTVSRQLASLRANVGQALQAHLPKQPDRVLVARIAEAEAALQGRRDILKFFQDGVTAKGPQYGYSSYMQAFARQSLQGVWLTGFSVDDEGRHVEIQGRAMQAELVPRYLGLLGREPLLKGREFSMLQLDGVAAAGAASAAATVSKGQPSPLSGVLEFKLQSVADPETKAAAGRAQS